MQVILKMDLASRDEDGEENRIAGGEEEEAVASCVCLLTITHYYYPA